jgi:hypothetical protein
LNLKVCNLCGGSRRLQWVSAVCQCTWGEEQVALQREENLGVPPERRRVQLQPGSHWHGAWLCVKCRQRALVWQDVAVLTTSITPTTT